MYCRDLCLKCCKLVMVLIKGLREPAKKALKMEVKFIKGKEEKEEAAERFQREMKAKANAAKQLSALISFKEALCTGTLCRTWDLSWSGRNQQQQ
jgi:uncharacterized protein YifE (UPF0438 family)